MKIAHFADVHVPEGRIAEFEIMIPQLIESVLSKKPDVVVFAGDIGIHRDRLVPKQVELIRRLFKEISEAGIDEVIIPGNHDTSMSEAKTDSLSAIFSYEHSNIHLLTKVGENITFGNVKFHSFPYPSKKEMVVDGASDIGFYYSSSEIFDRFKLDPDKKNILIFHGVLEGSMVNELSGSTSAIAVGKDLLIPRSFWGKFDAVMAGHLHGHQIMDNAVYPGCPFPLTYADDKPTGWVLWNGTVPEFVELPKLFPFITVDVGSLIQYKTELTEEAVRRLANNDDWANKRIRIKYAVAESQSGEVDHRKLSAQFKGAKDIRIVPEVKEIGRKIEHSVTFESFERNNLVDLIFQYIDEKDFNPSVKDVAKKVEDLIVKKHEDTYDRGVHFKLLSMKLKNFRSYGEECPEIDFTKLGSIVGIFGPNYSGKSSLVEAILWGLFGKPIRSSDVKSVIRDEADACEVSIRFQSFQAEYRIDRTRGRKSSNLQLFRKQEGNWIDISGADAKTTDSIISALIGSFDMFNSTIWSTQNNVDALVKKKPGERKQVIIDCLQIDALEPRQRQSSELHSKSKDRLSSENGRLDLLKERINKIINSQPEQLLSEFETMLTAEEENRERTIVHLNAISGYAQQFSDYEKQHNVLTAEIGATNSKIEETRSKIDIQTRKKDKYEALYADRSIVDDGLDRLERLNEDRERLTNEMRRLTDLRAQIAALQKELSTIESSYNSQIDTLKSANADASRQIAGLKLINCAKPDCPINEQVNNQKNEIIFKSEHYAEEIEAKIRDREVKTSAIKDKIIELERDIKNSFFDQTKYMEMLRLLQEEEAKKWPELKAQLSSGENLIEGILEVLVAYQTQKDELAAKKEELFQKRNEIIEKLASVDRYDTEMKKARAELAASNDRIRNYTDKIAKCKIDIEEINKLGKEITEQSALITKIEDYITHIKKYMEIVSKNGVIYSLVDRALPLVEKFAQELLSKTDKTIFLDAQKTLASGKKADEVTIWLSDSKGKRDVAESSGAEMVLVSFALRSAMAYLLSMRMGSKVELFVVDEGFGALDSENVVAMKEILTELGKKFNQVLFITHLDSLKDIAKSVINVEPGIDSSTFNIVEE